MKLTDKGVDKVAAPILDFVDGYYDQMIMQTIQNHEFEPTDFKNTVCLTVEEVNSLHDDIAWLCSTLEDYEQDHNNVPALFEGWRQMDLLQSKLDSMEGSND